MGAGGESGESNQNLRLARGVSRSMRISRASKGRHAGGAWTHFAIVPLTTWSRIILMGSMVPDGASPSPRKAET